MENAQPEGLLGLTIVIWASLVALGYVALRTIGILHPRGARRSRNRLQR
jgi:hypothetical protein